MTSADPVSALEVLRRGTWIDLTHAFHPGIPHSPFFKPEHRESLYDFDGSDGFLAHEYRLPGQWGTHVDPRHTLFPGCGSRMKSPSRK